MTNRPAPHSRSQTDVEASPLRDVYPLARPPLIAAILALALSVTGVGPAEAQDVSTVRQLIESQQILEALEVARKLTKREPKNAEAWLLLSEAQLMTGAMDEGRAALDKALRLNPNLRQAWLNRAALDMAAERYDQAIEAFRTAQKLDPSSADSFLNIGAVQVLSGKIPEAEQSFSDYIARAPRDGNAYYLVASNFAMGGYVARAAQYLEQSIALDERNRLRVRSDPNFDTPSADPRIQTLLLNDNYRPPEGSLTESHVFEAPYTGTTSTVLHAVADVLQLGGFRLDPRVEVTPEWAVMWSDVRIKIVARGKTHSEVQVTAPPGMMSPEQWKARAEKFFRDVTVQLVGRS